MGSRQTKERGVVGARVMSGVPACGSIKIAWVECQQPRESSKQAASSKSAAATSQASGRLAL